MRILHVAPFYEPAWACGGMARASATLCRALARRGHAVTVATALMDAGHPRQEIREGVRVFRFDSYLRRWLLPWAPGLGAFLAREAPMADVVHVHGHRSGLASVAVRAAAAAGVPCLLQPHGTYPHHGQHRLAKAGFDRLLGRATLAAAGVLVAVSDAEARELPVPARVIPNGVETPVAERPPRTPSPRLLFVGNDRPQKRGSLLKALLEALPQATLELAGACGPAFVRALAGLGSRVVASGVLDPGALARAYARADLVVHPAVGEAFGLVPFEAALNGTAAVAAGGHGCGEWLARAGGCVVAPDDAGALLAAVRARLADPGLAGSEAAAVADFARRELAPERAARAFESLYGERVAARRRGAA